MEKPHTKVFRKIRKSIEEGQRELKDIEAPKPISERLDHVRRRLDQQEEYVDEDYGK